MIDNLLTDNTRTAMPDVKRSTWWPSSRKGPCMSSALPRRYVILLPLHVSFGDSALKVFAVAIMPGLGSMPKALSKCLANGLVELPGPQPSSKRTFVSPPVDMCLSSMSLNKTCL